MIGRYVLWQLERLDCWSLLARGCMPAHKYCRLFLLTTGFAIMAEVGGQRSEIVSWVIRLSTRSGSAGFCSETAYRPMMIIWIYFHTSFLTSRWDCHKFLGLPVTLGPDYLCQKWTRHVLKVGPSRSIPYSIIHFPLPSQASPHFANFKIIWRYLSWIRMGTLKSCPM